MRPTRVYKTIPLDDKTYSEIEKAGEDFMKGMLDLAPQKTLESRLENNPAIPVLKILIEDGKDILKRSCERMARGLTQGNIATNSEVFAESKQDLIVKSKIHILTITDILDKGFNGIPPEIKDAVERSCYESYLQYVKPTPQNQYFLDHCKEQLKK